ncbi:hypothetical protein JMJ77_0008962, partial [Colletotrichum scovillei]
MQHHTQNVFNPRISAFSQILGRPDDRRANISKPAIDPSEHAFFSYSCTHRHIA